MTDFLARPLRALDGLFRFKGGLRGISQVDLRSPIIPVVDVSRMAMAAQGFQAPLPLTIDTVAASTQVFGLSDLDDVFALDEVAQKMDERKLSRAAVWVWLTGISALIAAADAANLDNAAQGIRQGTVSGSGVIRALMYYEDVNSALISGAAFPLGSWEANRFMYPLSQDSPYPILMEDDADTAFLGRVLSDASGGAAVTLYFWLWICPAGSFPPRA